ncbi:restin homolog [Photinus pyralis]|nr:restin homolog [Photinus pyralis]XP_031349265.1 restin homolog [Photinus pyralis]
MSQSITKRLEDLEKEIQILLTLQDIGSSGCHVLRGKSVTRHADGNVERIEFEGSNCLKAKSICSTQASSPTVGNTQTIRFEDGTRTPKTAKSSCVCGTKPVSGEISTAKSDSENETKSEDSKKSKKKSKRGKSKKGAGDKVAPKDDEDHLQKLQENFADLEVKLQAAEEEKSMALTANASLKQTNDELRANEDSNLSKIAILKQQNEELLRRLEAEKDNRSALEEKAKASHEREKKTLERLEVHTAKSTKKFRKRSEELTSVVKARDAHIRKLSDTTDKLVDSITEKEHEKRRLIEARDEAARHLLEAQHANRNLLETNAALLRNLKDSQEKFQAEKQNSQKMAKQIGQVKNESDKLKEEMERLRTRLKTALEGPREARHLAKLEERVRESREREEIWLNETALMEAKLKELQDEQNKASEAFDSELEYMRVANVKLKNKYEKAIDQVEQLKVDNEARIAEMKEDFDKISADFAKKFEHLRKEKKTLQGDFDQLATASQRDREALEQLIARTKKQDEVIAAQQDALLNKDDKLGMFLKDNANLMEQVRSAETKVNALKNTLEEQVAVGSDVNLEIDNLKAQIQHEREELIRKDVTISQHICKVEQLEHELANTEDKLKSALEECRLANEESKRTMEELHLVSCKLQVCEGKQEVMRRSLTEDKVKVCEEGDGQTLSARTFAVSAQFEKKLALMEEENRLQLDLVAKEKDHAVYAAKFSTQKLLETVTDFQRQVDVYKQLQLMLVKILQEKEECIQEMQRCPRCPIHREPVRKKSRSRRCRSCSVNESN